MPAIAEPQVLHALSRMALLAPIKLLYTYFIDSLVLLTHLVLSRLQDRKFYAHRIALLASSDTFRAMFDGHYKEKQASVIPIPNIRFAVFERMMRCIYTGTHCHAQRSSIAGAIRSCCEIPIPNIRHALVERMMHCIYPGAEPRMTCTYCRSTRSCCVSAFPNCCLLSTCGEPLSAIPQQLQLTSPPTAALEEHLESHCHCPCTSRRQGGCASRHYGGAVASGGSVHQ